MIPIVIYNGVEEWKEDIRFEHYFQIPDDQVKKYIPDFKYIMVDVNRLDETNLHEVEKASERICAIFRELKNRDPVLSKPPGRYMLGLLNYKGIEVEQVVDYLSEGGGKSMLAQSIEEIRREAREKGIEEGIEKGIEKGHKDLLETAKRMLLEGFDVEKTARLTGLSAEEIKQLKV